MAVSEEQRQTIRSLLNDGLAPEEIASRMGFDLSSVRAIKAHVTRGSYIGDEASTGDVESEIVDAFETKFGLERLIGQSAAMEEVFATILQVAPTRAPVLIQGESGTGKELVAHALHDLSGRPKERFVALH